MGEDMDKVREIETNLNHNVQINDRKSMLITGVKKVENFDTEEFFLETVMGYLLIKGQDLQLIKLDTLQGNLSIKGKVNSFNYLEQGKKKSSSESVLSKLFK